MYLERLEIQGFKTFAQKTTLEFIPPRDSQLGIAAIVGPNGSGKSNIADSIRWVLGEQSMKLLRGKKSEDVIFSGTEKRARAGFAEVVITLNNEDRRAPVDYTTLAIARRLFRDGNSEYQLNNKPTRLADIQLLLAQANFGQRTYSIIGQGMVDHVLVASPQERKEFFDEAAGVRQFQIKRDQAAGKLESTRENLAQAEGLLAEIEPRLRGLARQVRRLEERGPIETERQVLGRAYYGKIWRELLGAIVDLGEKIKVGEEKRAGKVRELDHLRLELLNWEKEETQATGFLELQKEYEALIEKSNHWQEEMMKVAQALAIPRTESVKTNLWSAVQARGQLENLARQQKEFFDQLDRVQSLGELETIREAGKKILLLTSEIIQGLSPDQAGRPIDEKLIKQKTKLEESLNVAKGKLAEVKLRIQNYSAEERAKKERIFSLGRETQGRQTELSAIDQEMNRMKIELARLEERRAGLIQEIKTEMGGSPLDLLIGELPALTRPPEETFEHLHRLKTQLEIIGSIDPEIIKEHLETKERHDFLKTQIDDLRGAASDLENGLAQLDQLIEERAEASFRTLNQEFGRYFKILFGGGHASLAKLKPAEEDEEAGEINESAVQKFNLKKEYTGIEINATPPGKRIKSINMLSGGERALTAIALICAIISQNPSPFIVLDEVDAALDESNSLRFASIVDELAGRTQFIIITHNRATMEKADVLYGVTMGEDGISRVLSLRLEEVDKR